MTTWTVTHTPLDEHPSNSFLSKLMSDNLVVITFSGIMIGNRFYPTVESVTGITSNECGGYNRYDLKPAIDFMGFPVEDALHDYCRKRYELLHPALKTAQHI